MFAHNILLSKNKKYHTYIYIYVCVCEIFISFWDLDWSINNLRINTILYQLIMK